MSDFQVIIIGGRPAGASLAIWLGRKNIRTLMVDRATFPSLPGVPSGPILYSQHIEMLEELGIPENALFHADGRIDTIDIEFVNYFKATIPVRIAGAPRPYAYGADRTRFDTAIWEHADRYDTVTARSGFSVTGILKENGRVTGIVGQTERGKEERFTADLVVGADGRFSFAAQQFEAATLEEYNDHMTSSFFADWENVPDGPTPHALSNYNTGKGLIVLMIPIDTRKYIVATYLRQAHQKSDQRLEEFYHDTLEAIPSVAERLREAKQVTPVIGVRGIRNGTRQAAGDGWALVGDALHYKDPLDGQGIYDALVEAKLLGEAIDQWQNGGRSWQEASQQYAVQVREATHSMMLHTVNNVRSTMYNDPPPFIIRSVVRWLMNSMEFKRDYMRMLTRQTDPGKPQDPGVIGRALMRGIADDLFRRKPIA